MQVNRKTRNIAKYIGHILISDKFMLGIEIDEKIKERCGELGFSLPLVEGERLLPSSKKGPACRRNAEGFQIIHRDQPMEIAHRQIEWHWKEFRGREDYEEKSGVKDVPYKRYPRTFVMPYGVELQIQSSKDGRKYVVSGPFENVPGYLNSATNTANVLREVLGGFEVLEQDPEKWTLVPVKKLNWNLLPPGKNPWDSALPVLEKMLKRAPSGNQNVLRARLAAVGEKKPDFVAVGLGGFDGYSAFGFSKEKFCILESPQVNNATYILPLASWEAISKLSKAEILADEAHTDRLIHNRNWFATLNKVFARGI